MNTGDFFDLAVANAPVLGTALGAADMPRGKTPAVQLAGKQDLQGSLDGANWKVSAGVNGSCALFVFSDAADVDADGIFGPAATSPAPAWTTKPGPLLHPVTGSAWVKLALAGAASATATPKAGAAKIQLSGQAKVGLGAYFLAPATSKLGAAVSAQTNLPFVLDPASIRGIATGQSAYVMVGGTLGAKLVFNWADVLTGPLPALQSLLGSKVPLNLAVDASAEVAVSVVLSDSFRLVFSGLDATHVRVALNRASSNAFTVMAGAKAVIHLEKPDVVRKLLVDLSAQLLGSPKANLDTLIAELGKVVTAYDDALAELESKIQGLAERLDTAIDASGLPAQLGKLAKLEAVLTQLAGALPAGVPAPLADAHVAKARTILDELPATLAAKAGTGLDALLDTLGLPKLAENGTAAVAGLLKHLKAIEGALTEAAKKRIEVGMNVEYSRVATNASLFVADLQRNHANFNDWHGGLLGMDLVPLLDASAAKNSGVKLQVFLNEKTVKRRFSMGVDLGWFFSEKDSADVQWTEIRRIVSDAAGAQHEERRVALKGSRAHADTIFGTDGLCRGDFEAEVVDKGTTLGKWQFMLSLSFASKIKKADSRWLRALADYAEVWGAVPPGNTDWLHAALIAAGASGKAVDAELSFVLDQSAFAGGTLFNSFTSATDRQMARAWAIALPITGDFAERSTADARAKTYTGAMEKLLSGNIDLTNTKAVARSVALSVAGTSVDAFEKAWQPEHVGSVVKTIQDAGSIIGRVNQFRSAGQLASLTHGSNLAAEKKLVRSAFVGWDEAWRNRYFLRWQVALLRDLVQSGSIPGSSSVLKLSIGNQGKVHIFSASA